MQTTGLILKEYTSKFFSHSHTPKYSSNIWKLFLGNAQQFRKRFEALAFVKDNSGELLQVPLCDKETLGHTPHIQMTKKNPKKLHRRLDRTYEDCSWGNILLKMKLRLTKNLNDTKTKKDRRGLPQAYHSMVEAVWRWGFAECPVAHIVTGDTSEDRSSLVNPLGYITGKPSLTRCSF